MPLNRLGQFTAFFCGSLLTALAAMLVGASRPAVDDSITSGDNRPLAAATFPTPASMPPSSDGKLRIIAFGAHPDDCEIREGGVAALWAAQGHHVKFVSCTNGDIGHWGMAGGPLARRRLAEVKRCAAILGIETEVLDIHDGELMVTLENRKTVCRLIREWNADLVISHRPNDYHPDHRYTGLLVQDAGYMVTVPHFCPDVPYLKKNPVFLFSEDGFQKPTPFAADIIVGIDDVVEKKLTVMATLHSQFYEGGATGGPQLLPDPNDADAVAARRNEVRSAFERRFAGTAAKFRTALEKYYGGKADSIRFAEAFEICEYGRRPSPDEIRQLFPFYPAK